MWYSVCRNYYHKRYSKSHYKIEITRLTDKYKYSNLIIMDEFMYSEEDYDKVNVGEIVLPTLSSMEHVSKKLGIDNKLLEE
jgi:hypothetical protein